jgi:hypothetical protein
LSTIFKKSTIPIGSGVKNMAEKLKIPGAEPKFSSRGLADIKPEIAAENPGQLEINPGEVKKPKLEIKAGGGSGTVNPAEATPKGMGEKPKTPNVPTPQEQVKKAA